MGINEGIFERNMGAMVVAACVGVFVALTFSNAYLLDRSSQIADQVRHDQEKILVSHDIAQLVEVMAIDQSQISHFDDSVEALSGDIDQDYVKDEIAEWMWDDFDIQMSVVVSPDNKPTVTVYEKNVMQPEQGVVAVVQNIDLIEGARKAYSDYVARQTVPVTAFSGMHDPVRSEHPMYVWSIRNLNGQLTFAMAQAIVPDEDEVVPSEGPAIFLTFKPLDKQLLEKAGRKLELVDFRLTTEDQKLAEAGTLFIATLKNGKNVHARWTPGAPSQTIWDQTLLTLALPYLVAALALLLIASHFGRMLHALQKSEEKNRFLAFHDALTGLPNRMHFDHELEAIVAEGKQDRCAILCMDLDRFKAVNDTFGHQAGDVVLEVISQRIQDRVGDTGMAARVGGDEFIILLHDNLEQDAVMYLCDQMIEDICIPIDIPGGTAEVGASIGVAWWPDDALTVKSIIRSADEALYCSKENGRGQVSCASKLSVTAAKDPFAVVEDAVNQIKDEMQRAG